MLVWALAFQLFSREDNVPTKQQSCNGRLRPSFLLSFFSWRRFSTSFPAPIAAVSGLAFLFFLDSNPDILHVLNPADGVSSIL